MKVKLIKLVLFIVFLQSTFSALACDMNLVGLLAASDESRAEFSDSVTEIASHTRLLSTILSEFLQKNQKYYFPPKNVNGQYISSDIDKNTREANEFVKQFADLIDHITVLWASLKGDNSIQPPLVTEDKNWHQKCQNIENALKVLKEKAIARNFDALHESISGLYVGILSLLEQAQKDDEKSSLMAISEDILKLIHGIEQSRMIDIEMASFALVTHVDKLEKSLPHSKRVFLNVLKSVVDELADALKNERSYLLVELTGKIEHNFREVIKRLSEK